MKFDVITIVVLVFCLGVGITIAAEAKSLFRAEAADVLVAKER
jgi:hypothetical protein